MLLLLALAATAHAAATPPPGPATPAAAATAGRTIVARKGEVRASQIANVPADADAIVARLPAGANEVEWSEETRLMLLHSRYPGRRYALRQPGPLRVTRETPPETSETCLAAREPVAAGTYLAETHVLAAPCRAGEPGGWLGYDAGARAFFARRAIPAGTYLGRFAPADPPAAVAGAPLVLRAASGPVAVEREVVALQSGRRGRAVFVRTGDGKVVDAQLAGNRDPRAGGGTAPTGKARR